MAQYATSMNAQREGEGEEKVERPRAGRIRIRIGLAEPTTSTYSRPVLEESWPRHCQALTKASPHLSWQSLPNFHSTLSHKFCLFVLDRNDVDEETYFW
jgi:hypothetical protein